MTVTESWYSTDSRGGNSYHNKWYTTYHESYITFQKEEIRTENVCDLHVGVCRLARGATVTRRVDDKKTTAEPINDSSMLWKYERKKKRKV